MTFSRYLTVVALISLAACEPSVGTPVSTSPSANVVGGLGPPSGRTETERQTRKDYYRGPRGDDF